MTVISSLSNDYNMLQLPLLCCVLSPMLSIPLLYLLPKKIHPGMLVSSFNLVQLIFWISFLPSVYNDSIWYTLSDLFTLSNGCKISIGCYVDLISGLMLMMVSLISFIVALYSIAYLPTHASPKRYFSLYSLSLAAMYSILVADHLWSMFLGWECLSIASCFLVSFWYQDIVVVQAGKYTWLMNKIGSIFFMIGMLLMVVMYNNPSIPQINSSWSYHSGPYSHIAGLCFVIAGCTKAAQFPFFSWLPHAMAAPVPISALLHTATVLSAGVYLLVRIQPILYAELNDLLITIGYITAFIGAISAWFQEKIKRMLAYATLSQFGYIVAAIGLGDTYAAIVYLIMHAFSKTCLFLFIGIASKLLKSQGYDKQESCITMSCMGKVLKRCPLSLVLYIITLWGIGIIPGSISFVAKEHILEKTFLWACEGCCRFRFVVLFLACGSACVTLFYILNAFVRIFCNNERGYKITIPSLLKGYKKYALMYSSIVMCSACILIAPYVLQQYTAIVDNIYLSSVDVYLVRILRIFIAYFLFLFIGHMVTRLLLPHVYAYKWIKYALRFLLFPLMFGSRHSPSFNPPIRFNYTKKYFYSKESPRINAEIWDYTVYPKKSWLGRMFLQGWYVDACVKFLGKQIEALSQYLHHIEKKYFHQYIYKLVQAILVVAKGIHKFDKQLHQYIYKLVQAILAIAKGIHQFDKKLLNVCVSSIVIFSQSASRMYLRLQIEQVQRYMLWSCIGLSILIFVWILSLL